MSIYDDDGDPTPAEEEWIEEVVAQHFREMDKREAWEAAGSDPATCGHWLWEMLDFDPDRPLHTRCIDCGIEHGTA